MEDARILVVDDAIFIRKLLGNTLKELGYSNIEYARDGFEAIKKAEEIQPHVITLDVSMPGMDGLEAIDKILKVSAKSKIVMVSAVKSQQVINSAIARGAADYIPKPFSKREIENSMKKLL
ncbi:response regulator [Acetivibrio clariflavus]|uniref:Stage 0 sporulation protein A homolog n=1 Tax=Acetivibrio clariflavus (strain DSM 19732 / NBRC 101661 / EBR45) TaxID=720554 RepID=G8LTE3_ACECE|nr:response regulator [Acetivibrio clariflavus]AEV69438.1 response regulator containing CheY-like receiver domain and AraC-type DNA-binding domain [Acetivibrio clariflavus DSM 19732]